MKRLLPLLLLTFTSISLFAQSNPDFDNYYLSRAGINRLANNKFGSLVTGQSGTANLVNYASFNPAAGSFTFNGSVPLGADNDSSIFSFLSLKISGDLISDSYAALFQNSKLNTDASVSGQWDIRFKKSFHYNFRSSDQFNLIQKLNDLEFHKNESLKDLASQISSNMQRLSLARLQVTIYDSALLRYADSLKNLNAALADLVKTKPDSITKIKLIVDSLTKQNEQVTEIKKKRSAAEWQCDSLNNLVANFKDFRNAAKNKIYDDYYAKKRLLEDSAAISGITFGWLSFVASGGKKNYYTFDAMAPFSEQIQKKDINTWRLGIVYNHYKEKSFPKRILLWNIGVFRYEDNNTALLSTTDVAQERDFTNTAGDTTRKVTKTYKAYTDAVIDSKVLNFTSNIYFLYTSKKSGFHLYPSVDIYDNSKTLANLGIGYLISFKNTEKDKPIINAEGYVQFQDIGNAMKKEGPFFRRNEIGIRFALPFSFFN